MGNERQHCNERLRLLAAVALSISVCVLAASSAHCGELAASVDLTPRTLEPIPPGTQISKNGPPNGWSQTLLVAQPRVTHGDVKDVMPLAVDLAKMLNTVLLAKRGGSPGNFTLEKVAIGFAMVINGRNTIVTSETQESLGANLGFIERQVLSEQERYLGETIQVARTPTMMVVDSKATMLREDKHRRLTIRFVVLVHRERGGIGSLVWMLDQDSQGRTFPADNQMVFLPANMHEDRILNVKASEFTLGIPSANAFAMVRLPRGTPQSTPVGFTPSLREIAAVTSFVPQNVLRLESALWNLWKQPQQR